MSAIHIAAIFSVNTSSRGRNRLILLPVLLVEIILYTTFYYYREEYINSLMANRDMSSLVSREKCIISKYTFYCVEKMK